MEIPSKIAEGTMKYQNFCSKKDSIFSSPSSIVQVGFLHEIVVISYHLNDNYII